jgi:hypothetical protein
LEGVTDLSIPPGSSGQAPARRRDELAMTTMLGAVLRGTAVAGAAAILARLAMLHALWGSLAGHHGWPLRVTAFAMATCAVLAAALVPALAIAHRAPSTVPRPAVLLATAAIAAASQAAWIAILDASLGGGARADLELPLSSTPAALAFAAALALGCAPRGSARPASRAAAAGRGALAGGPTLAAIHALGTGLPGAVPAGLLEGAAIGAGFAIALAPRERRDASAPGAAGRCRFAIRLLVATAAAAGLALLAGWAHAWRTVRAEVAGTERLVEEVLRLPRCRDPIVLRWVSDIRVREEKALEWARHLPKYLAAMYGPFERPWRAPGPIGTIRRHLEDARRIARALLADARGVPFHTEPASSAARLLRLVAGFRVPAALEMQEQGGRNALVVFRGGVPLFAVSAIGAEQSRARDAYRRTLELRERAVLIPPIALSPAATARLAAEAPGTQLPPVTMFRMGGRNVYRAGGWFYEVAAPTARLRDAVVQRLLEDRPLAPGDDLLVDADLASGERGGSEASLISPTRPDTIVDPGSLATARRWLSSGLFPLFGDLHTHSSESLGGCVPASTAARAALASFCHFHALTEHFAPAGNAKVARLFDRWAPGSTFICGEEAVLSRAHICGVGLRPGDWVPTAWFTFTAPPQLYAGLFASAGALPVLAHPMFPQVAWQRENFPRWRALGVAATEDDSWMEPDDWENLADRPPLLGISDSHSGCVAATPRTLVLARDVSAGAILDAVRAGRVLSIRLDRPLYSRGNPAMRAALWLLLTEPGRLARSLSETWTGAGVARAPVAID